MEVLENDETTFIAHSFSLHLLVTATLLTLRGTPLVLEHVDDEEGTHNVTYISHVDDEEGTHNVTYISHVNHEEGKHNVTYMLHILNEEGTHNVTYI